MRSFPIIDANKLSMKLGYHEAFKQSEKTAQKELQAWRMEDDDAPIFRYLYRNFNPKRHLEFGTWQGSGTVYCLEESGATVWTVNTPFGERNASGSNAYGYFDHELNDLLLWAEKVGLPVRPQESKNSIHLSNFFRSLLSKKDQIEIRTDSVGFIGRHYLSKDLGHRVCQIYSDSIKWETSAYPDGFFDSALVDGGHMYPVVESDTKNALRLVRSGGLIMWHDFCPDPEVLKACESPRDVVGYFEKNWDYVNGQMKDLFWIKPSWILLGIKK